MVEKGKNGKHYSQNHPKTDIIIMSKLIKTADGYQTDKGVPVRFFNSENQEIKEIPQNDSKNQ